MRLGLVIALVFVFFSVGAGAVAAPVPPRPEQPHSDVFEVAPYGNLQPLNPVTVKAKAQRSASYRLITMPGCVTGSVPSDMGIVEHEAAAKLGFALLRSDTAYDFTIRINCGSEQIRICGSVTVFCLGRGFPFVADVDISDILSAWALETRVSILLHEVVGHALATWMEQYCLGQNYPFLHPCFGLARFAPTPNWLDFMNTGPNSRHRVEQIELERWHRTMYEPADPCLGAVDQFGNQYNACKDRWIAPTGWEYDYHTGAWYLPNGTTPEWLGCDAFGNRYFPLRDIHLPAGGSPVYTHERGFWSAPPTC